MDNLTTEVEKYLLVCKNAKGLSPLTLKAYTIDFKQFSEYMAQRDYLMKDNIASYIDFLHAHYKPKSAKRKIACIKAFYRHMEIEDILKDNPFHKIKIKYKEPLVLPKTIPLDYINRILQYAYKFHSIASTPYQREASLRNISVLELLFSTGMRVSEVSRLKIHDIDFTNNTLRIFGKGAKERIMCLTNEGLLNVLKAYLNCCSHNSEFVFINRRRNRLSEQSIRNMVHDYAESAGVSLHITPHMFRHTFATSLLDEDVDIRYIQQLLGHSSIVTTQIYTHISTNKIRSILQDKHPRNKLKFNISCL